MLTYLKENKLIRNILIGLVVAIILVALIVSAGWYPLVVVSKTPVLASEHAAAYDLSYAYYAYLTQKDRTAAQDRELQTQLKPAVLQGLIDEVLVRKELAKRMGKNALEKKLEEKMQVVWGDETARAALVEMTKASAHDIQKYLLEPQALNQLLDELLRLDGKNLQGWLTDARAQTRPRCIAPSVKCLEDRVEFKD